MQFSARQQFFNWVLGRIEEIINFLRLEARILPFCWAKEDPDAQPNINEGDIEMLVTKKMLLALTLIGALVGAGIGALVTRTATTTSAADTSYNTPANSDRTQTQPVNYNTKTPEQVAADNSTQFSTPAEQTAYREGFDAGYAACSNPNTNYSRTAYQTRASYRAPRRSSTRRVYYDYGTAPRGRSFWQKHRDKLTLAIGTGAGAAIGGLIGGKKGAGIGALAGLGSSALYTYKLRKRNRSY